MRSHLHPHVLLCSGIDQQAKTVRVHALDYLVSRLTFEDRLLLIDDVFDSGRSLEAVIAELRKRCRRNLPEHIRIATVYYKPSRNRSLLMPDYYVRSTDQWLVFPHEAAGIDARRDSRAQTDQRKFFRREASAGRGPG